MQIRKAFIRPSLPPNGMMLDAWLNYNYSYLAKDPRLASGQVIKIKVGVQSLCQTHLWTHVPITICEAACQINAFPTQFLEASKTRTKKYKQTSYY